MEEFVEEETGPTWQLPCYNPATASWNLAISKDDLSKFETGFEPRDLSDMWYVKPMPRDESGRTLVHFARFWAESPVYTIVIRANDDGSGIIESVTWETRENGETLSEAWVKKDVVRIARDTVECELPGLPEPEYEEWFPTYAAYKNCAGRDWAFA